MIPHSTHSTISNLLAVVVIAGSLTCHAEETVFPHRMPAKEPAFPLSAAMDRMFDFPAPRVQDNELYTLFKYTPVRGFDYHGGDGTVSRRDLDDPVMKVSGINFNPDVYFSQGLNGRERERIQQTNNELRGKSRTQPTND